MKNQTILPPGTTRRITLVIAGAMLAMLSGTSPVLGKSRKPAPEAEVDKTATITGEKKTETVHISVQTLPARKAFVKWGRKSLGVIPVPKPLVIERPRDSGPLDLVLRAPGYLPVHTRVYTFSDSRVLVKLTPPEEKNKLFGYREEPAPNADTGAPATTQGPAGSPAAPAPPAAGPLP